MICYYRGGLGARRLFTTFGHAPRRFGNSRDYASFESNSNRNVANRPTGHRKKSGQIGRTAGERPLVKRCFHASGIANLDSVRRVPLRRRRAYGFQLNCLRARRGAGAETRPPRRPDSAWSNCRISDAAVHRRAVRVVLGIVFAGWIAIRVATVGLACRHGPEASKMSH